MQLQLSFHQVENGLWCAVVYGNLKSTATALAQLDKT